VRPSVAVSRISLPVFSVRGLIFEVLKGDEVALFWNVAPDNLVDIDQRFGGVYYFHHQGDE
jgi:hypothetical protein